MALAGPRAGISRPAARDVPRKEKRRGMTAAFIRKSTCRSNYFETDFLNMRSIFSLICSIACEFC
jgi:hypothetical protein